MKEISTLIDAGTLTKKIIIQSVHCKKESGWLACIIKGELIQKFMYYTDQGERYVIHDGENYLVNTPLKPISGVFQASMLYGYY